MQDVLKKRYAIDARGLTEEIIEEVRSAGSERKIGFLHRIPGEGRLYKELMKAAADNGSSIFIYNLDKSIFVQ